MCQQDRQAVARLHPRVQGHVGQEDEEVGGRGTREVGASKVAGLQQLGWRPARSYALWQLLWWAAWLCWVRCAAGSGGSGLLLLLLLLLVGIEAK